jgi:hypothetical protein
VKRLVPVLLLVVAAGLGAALWARPAAPPPEEASDAEVAEGEEASPEDGVDGGKWRKFRTRRFDNALSASQRQEIEALEAIGYVENSSKKAEGGIPTIAVWDKERSYNGRNFWISGHASEAYLTDMAGEVLHTWRSDFWKIWPDYPAPKNDGSAHHYRRAFVYPNGDCLLIHEGRAILKVDKDSNVLWAQPNRAHHDAWLAPDGGVFVLTREADVVKELDDRRPVLDDFIVQLDAAGNETRRVSVLKAFSNSPEFAEIFSTKNMPARTRDVFHTNSLEILDGSIAATNPEFKAGRALISMRTLSAVAVVDLDTEKIVWAKKDSYVAQHDAKILPGIGDLMVFDNQGGPRRASRVIEYKLPEMSVVWTYPTGPGQPLRSETLGTGERLPNGNTLITESDGGRALEVTPDGTTVWEMFNPHRAGEGDEYIAALFEVVRLPPDFGDSFIKR